MSGRGNASGSSTPRIGDQSNSKGVSSNKKQCQRCRNDCVKEFMKCAVCEFVFHAKCEGVTSQQFSLFRELEKLKTPFEWLCSTCRKVDVMNIMKTMHLMQNKIENFEKEVASLKQRNISDPDNVESSHTKNSSQNSSLSDAINEALDIERRKYNLVISGMPICDNTSDLDLLQSLLEDPVLDITGNVNINNVQRIGNKGLMIISFDNLDSKRSILQSARKLRSSMTAAHRGIFISPDLTRKQRQVEYNLRSELRTRRENGETGLRISKGKIVQSIVPTQNISTPSLFQAQKSSTPSLFQAQNSSTPHVIRVATGGKLAPQSPDTRVHVQNTPNTPGRKLPHQPQTQPHIVKVGDLAFKSPVASGSSALAGAHRIMEKN